MQHCYNSFNVRINQIKTLTSPITEFKSWNNGTENYFTIDIPDASTIEIEGFKNVDIYGFNVTGNVRASASAANGGAVINNWAIKLFFIGNLPLISAKVAPALPNFYQISLGSNAAKGFNLSKNTNQLDLNDPIKSVKQIYFEGFQCDGFGLQTIGTITLEYDFNFTFKYKYQEE